jgi:hypothetical protein
MGVTIMKSIQTNWEDEENNRCVGLDVQYQLVGGRAEISSVTPTRVSFTKRHGRFAGRTLGVWTETGRAMLVRQAIAAGRIGQLQRELETGTLVKLASTAKPVATATEPCPLSA